MKRIDLSKPGETDPVALIIGNYDGVHRGHQAIIEHSRTLAQREGLHTALLSFEPHPLKVLAPDRAPRLILTPAQKHRLLAFHGIDYYMVQPFDLAFSRLSPEDFVHHLCQRVVFRHVLVGFNFRFGHRRAGDVDRLTQIGKDKGFQVGIADPRRDEIDVISSSRIRGLIADGDLVSASKLLGRPYFLEGKVAPGQQLGRELQSPTANIAVQNELLPRFGVYASWTRTPMGWYRSITNIGKAPTLGRGSTLVETRLFDFDDHLYGQDIVVCPAAFLRPEQTFADLEALRRQIAQDVAQRLALPDRDPPKLQLF